MERPLRSTVELLISMSQQFLQRLAMQTVKLRDWPLEDTHGTRPAVTYFGGFRMKGAERVGSVEDMMAHAGR